MINGTNAAAANFWSSRPAAVVIAANATSGASAMVTSCCRRLPSRTVAAMNSAMAKPRMRSAICT
jgi:hypothetical protein